MCIHIYIYINYVINLSNINNCLFRYGFIYIYKVKVKVTFTLEQGTKSRRGSRGIVLLFL